MSEFKGPWKLSNGNFVFLREYKQGGREFREHELDGWLVHNHLQLPDDAVPLVPKDTSQSLPDVKSPEALRYAADVVEAYGFFQSAQHFHDMADHREREQVKRAEQATRDNAIEQAAKAMYEGYNNKGSDWAQASAASRNLYRQYARDLADAGLLNIEEDKS